MFPKKYMDEQLNLKFTEQYDPLTLFFRGLDVVTGNLSVFVRDTCVNMPTEFGLFKLFSYRNQSTNESTLAIVKGIVEGKTAVPLRVHSSCVTGDILGSLRCDCRRQLIKALKVIEQAGEGVVIYAFQEGRGIGLINKLRAYYLQEHGYDTVDANLALGFPEDLRTYSFVKNILDDLGVQGIRLLTNNPDKVKQLQDEGVNVTGVIKHEVKPCGSNAHYLYTKKYKMGHLLTLV